VDVGNWDETVYLEVLVKEDKVTHPFAGRGTHGTDHDVP